MHSLWKTVWRLLKKLKIEEHLGGLVQHLTLDFVSGHNLMVHEIKSCVWLCADSSRACLGFSHSLFLCPSPVLSLNINKLYLKKKVKNRTALRPSNYTTRYLPKDTKIQIQRDTCIVMFIAALSTIAKLWKEPKCVHQLMNG